MRRNRQTHKQTVVKTLPPRLPSAWIATSFHSYQPWGASYGTCRLNVGLIASLLTESRRGCRNHKDWICGHFKVNKVPLHTYPYDFNKGWPLSNSFTVIYLLFAFARQIMQSVLSVRPSVRPFVSTLSFKSTDLWTWYCVCLRAMTIALLGFKVIGYRSRSNVNVGLTSILDRRLFS